MSIVLIHGVPETAEVWGPLRSRLDRQDVSALALPGFGSPRPEGFGATKEAYVDWLVAELEGMQGDGPLDVVGHDWGGGFVVRLVSTRPDLVRSWVTDAAGIGDADFEWHDVAKVWQTPEAREAMFDAVMAQAPEDRAPMFEGAGVPHDEAVALAGHLDAAMADCILALYRSATDVGREWSPDFHDVTAPGLVLLPSDDPFLDADGARRGAQRAGATVAELAGLGHWWLLQDPARGAEVLQRFWAQLP